MILVFTHTDELFIVPASFQWLGAVAIRDNPTFHRTHVDEVAGLNRGTWR